MKRIREPFEINSKKKTQKLGEPSVSKPPMPLVSSSPSKSQPSESPTLHLRQLPSSLPQPSPIYTHYEPTTSTTNPSETHTSNPPSPPLQPINLTTTTLPISEALVFNKPISPPSSTPSSPPYYNISFDSDHPEPSDPQIVTLAQLQAHTLSTQNPPEPETSIPSPSEHPTSPASEHHTETRSENPVTQTSDPLTEIIPTPPEPILPTSKPEPISPTSEPEPTFPTLEEAVTLFAECLLEKLRSLSENSKISDDPSTVRIHWNRVIGRMTSKAFKMKGISEQVRNDFIKEAGERLHTRLAGEEEDRAHRKSEEKACLEKEENARRETAEKASAEATATEVKAKAKVDAGEASHISVEEATKAKDIALSQGESSHSDFSPLVLKTLEELHKEQQIMRARLDQQDSVNSNIQNLLTQLL
ncbi:uncharacterized protein LOC127131443 [Lathyrus oleraceus]|uniref:uncharacterized protein LOC127131443 n=1 Tax=Pisum sativum TaxID=3888 RepID=UPI0021CE841B|nr:uncharacterized protein LOC127131443 [Pisum sativum]